jgi:hypothetical protein
MVDENTQSANADVEADGDGRDEEEVFEALEKLGDLFERGAMSLRPGQVITETQKGDRAAFFRNFKGQRLEKFTRKKVQSILHKEIFGRKNLFMAHLYMVMWNEQNRNLYSAIRAHVETISEDVETIESIEDDKAQAFVADMVENGHEKEDIFICVRINDVRFTESFIQANLI